MQSITFPPAGCDKPAFALSSGSIGVAGTTLVPGDKKTQKYLGISEIPRLRAAASEWTAVAAEQSVVQPYCPRPCKCVFLAVRVAAPLLSRLGRDLLPYTGNSNRQG